ncbi:aspartate carbamoyltransferase catalytic subunit [Irregularibacter muris]|uniref:Aspartate carbamoyltransferase n=1 Tax=Irregularibacter muris TaxID=1796619 RepID=A0AAE3L318_9FIRM|nr:aspartate carbamoyltransferase catalytic subunit [Irregularibacter muris]MCR1899729.1 aspartate carbamoyltransferase catalytic subunit [Irregularibacter muris]
MNYKNLLGLRDLSAEEIQEILTTAHLMRPVMESPNKKITYLMGKNILTLFYESSTRTRVSFELAAKYLGATTTNVSVATSSVNKGESLIDTVRTLQSMGVDIVIMRHPMTGAPKLLADHIEAKVINAGDGINEHPTQALLDLYTIERHKGRIKDLKVVIAGDILHSRVARSNIWGLTKMGARVVVAGPSTLIPKKIEKMGVEVFQDIKKAVVDADVVMALRMQKERQESGLFPSLREYQHYFGIDEGVLSYAKPEVLLMHPGPVNRGIEITSDIMEGPHSTIEEQVTNGVAIRMALLYLMTRGGDKQ